MLSYCNRTFTTMFSVTTRKAQHKVYINRRKLHWPDYHQHTPQYSWESSDYINCKIRFKKGGNFVIVNSFRMY